MIVQVKWFSSFIRLLPFAIILQEVNGRPGPNGDENLANNHEQLRSSSIFQPPKSLYSPTGSTHRLLVSGGQSNLCPTVSKALKQSIGSYESRTRELMDDIVGGLRYAFQTKNNWTLPIVGTGTYGMSTILMNLLEPGDTLLVPITGHWGLRAAEIGRKIYGVNVVTTEVKEAGDVFTLQEYTDAVVKYRPNVVLIVHGDSSTGALQSVSGVGELCRKYDCLVILDTVTTLTGIPVYIDKWKIDAAYANSQKGLCSIVGMSPITIGPRAVARILRRTTPVVPDTLDIRKLANLWCDPGGKLDLEPNGTAYFSNPVSQIYALRESVSVLAKETLQVRWRKTKEAASHLIEELNLLDIKPFVKNPKRRVHTTTIFELPHNINIYDLEAYSTKTYKIDLGDGYYRSAYGTLRIALYGLNPTPENVDAIAVAVKTGIEYLRTKN